ncbi:hypothetical protein GCM10011415_32610 [Salipiger pallidus]|uniref:Methyl-accepting chemotaxis protein n=1 Tax=Salipiger pallidus TaxID=1775170 RepID=A0A8J2ZM93_9RHOB|nr:methyl-accepting chemotaxis protein [Salipiger pallidus]GGG80678.1 hypothetical protein GCM10011415_32610 [Salipiger pallidus]
MIKKFPIRIQIMALGMAFALLILASGILSWSVQSRVARDIQLAFDRVVQNETIALIREDMEQARVNVMEFAAGDQNAVESMVGNFKEVTDVIAQDLHKFTDPRVSTALREDYAEALLGVSARISDLSARASELDWTSGQAPSTIQATARDIFQAIGVEIATVDDIQEVTRVTAVQTEDRTKESVSNSMTMLLLSLAGITAVSMLMVFFFGGVIARPLSRSAKDVEAISAGNYDIEISGTDRGDEAGVIARNLESLRESLRSADLADAKERAANDRRVALFGTLGKAMEHLSDGKFEDRIDPSEWQDLGQSYADICGDFNSLCEKIGDLILSLQDSAKMVQRSSQGLSQMSTEMSRRSEVQAATLEESAAALEQLSSSVKTAAENADAADKRAGDGRRRAEEAGEVMDRALQAMSSIATSSDQITQIIGVIDDIAFQTNLLALNAGVEAARAGESGKGFSVVASEVRSLAQRASESAREIKALVSNSSQQVKDGGQLVEQTGDSLADIVRYVSEVSGMVSEIASAAREQAAGVQEINVGVAELDKVTQQNAAMVGETSTASQQLSQEADRLTTQLANFSGSGVDGRQEVDPIAVPFEEIDDALPMAGSGQAAVPMPQKVAVNSGAQWEDF